MFTNLNGATMKLNQVQRDELLTGLQILMDNGPSDPFYGICNNLEAAMGYCLTVDPYLFVSLVSVSWPGITGTVHTSEEDGEPESCYPIARTYADGRRDPLWAGVQLKQRNELMQYLVNWLKAYEVVE